MLKAVSGTLYSSKFNTWLETTNGQFELACSNEFLHQYINPRIGGSHSIADPALIIAKVDTSSRLIYEMAGIVAYFDHATEVALFNEEVQIEFDRDAADRGCRWTGTVRLTPENSEIQTATERLEIFENRSYDFADSSVPWHPEDDIPNMTRLGIIEGHLREGKIDAYGMCFKLSDTWYCSEKVTLKAPDVEALL